MSLEEVNVDEVVRAVLARLRGDKQSTHERARKLVLRGGLVTELDLAEQLRGESVVCVEEKTVITPSARDYLRARGIAIEIEKAKARQTGGGSGIKLVVAVAATTFEPSGMITRIVQQGGQVEQLARVGLAQVADELTQRVALGGDRGLLFTEQAIAALCLVNRVPGVRGATADCAGDMQTARREVGANVLIVNPKRKNSHTLWQLLHGWSTAPNAMCPGELTSRLG